ncbi:hypothetical protein [Bacteriovorax stolpii]|nr:hypothetical protein [Bacteriovorax stolpii]
MATLLCLFCSLSAFALEDWKSQIIADAKTLYTEESIREFSKPIEFTIQEDITAAASARHDFDKLTVVINTGLLNSSRLTPDSFRMILCHELGHLFGGAPRKNVPPEWDGPVGSDGMSLMSSEGQADYYASSACFKRILTLEKHSSKIDLKRAGPALKKKCQVIAKKEGKDFEICLRSALAGLDFLNLVRDFPISCEHEDKTVAKELIRDFYPDRQCRLDTIINGTLCSEVLPLSLHPFDDSKNTCVASYALRPKCWFP